MTFIVYFNIIIRADKVPITGFWFYIRFKIYNPDWVNSTKELLYHIVKSGAYSPDSAPCRTFAQDELNH